MSNTGNFSEDFGQWLDRNNETLYNGASDFQVYPERVSTKKLRTKLRLEKEPNEDGERDLTATISILKRDPEFDRSGVPAYTFTPLAVESFNAMKSHVELSKQLNQFDQRSSKQNFHGLSKCLYIVKNSEQPASVYFRYRVDRPWWVKIEFNSDFKEDTPSYHPNNGEEIEIATIMINPAFDEQKDWNMYELVERFEGDAQNKSSPENILQRIMQFALAGLFRWSGNLMNDVINTLKFTEFFDEVTRSCVIVKATSYNEMKEVFKMLQHHDPESLELLYPVWMKNIFKLSPKEAANCGFDIFIAYPSSGGTPNVYSTYSPNPNLYKPIGWAILGPVCEPDFTEQELESNSIFDKIETMSFRPLLSIGVDHQDFRGQGIGTQLFQRCLQSSKESVHVYCTDTKMPTLAFFKKAHQKYIDYMHYIHKHTNNAKMKAFFAECNIHKDMERTVKSMEMKERDRKFHTLKNSLLLSSENFCKELDDNNPEAVKTVSLLEDYVCMKSHVTVSYIKVKGIPQRRLTKEEAKFTLYRMKCLTVGGYVN
jgi:hypothetical protein